MSIFLLLQKLLSYKLQFIQATDNKLSTASREDMKKIFIISSLIILLYPGLLHAFYMRTASSEGYIVVRSEYYKLCQGEIIKISLSAPNTLDAWAHFNKKDYKLVPNVEGTSFFTLIGLGLDMEPGVYNLLINIVFSDGSKKILSTKIAVTEGVFTIKKMNVDKKFISPSPEAQERIKYETELINNICRKSKQHWLGKGNFIFPLKGKAIQNFGDRRIFNNDFHSRHRGIDIRSRSGKLVKATNSGRVVIARNLYFAGNTVIIDHGIGLFSIYCHLSKMLVRDGKTVKKGDPIGRVGSTGRVTGPHLHWSFKVFDEHINPFSILRLSFD